MNQRAIFRIIIAVGVVIGIATVGIPLSSQWSGTVTEKTSSVKWSSFLTRVSNGKDPQTYEVVVACSDGKQRVGHIKDMHTWMALNKGDMVVKTRGSFDASKCK